MYASIVFGYLRVKCQGYTIGLCLWIFLGTLQLFSEVIYFRILPWADPFLNIVLAASYKCDTFITIVFIILYIILLLQMCYIPSLKSENVLCMAWIFSRW